MLIEKFSPYICNKFLEIKSQIKYFIWINLIFYLKCNKIYFNKSILIFKINEYKYIKGIYAIFFYKKLINIIYMINYNIYQIFIKKLALLTYFIIFFWVFSAFLWILNNFPLIDIFVKISTFCDISDIFIKSSIDISAFIDILILAFNKLEFKSGW